MTDPTEVRTEILEAMDALNLALEAIMCGDTRAAATQLDKAAVIAAEVRRQIFPSQKSP